MAKEKTAKQKKKRKKEYPRKLVYIGKVNGKRKYESISAPTWEEVELLAARFKLDARRQKNPANLTLGEAMDKYIETKSNILSPSTIREYKRCRSNDFPSIIDLKLSNITQEKIQIAINELSVGHSPKFVRNAHGFLSAVLKVYNPYFTLNTTLPQRKKSEIQIPTEDEVKMILDAVKDTVMEIPVYLAATCGLRRSEICGLKWSDIDLGKQTITIRRARVKGSNNQTFEKGTKTRAGERTIHINQVMVNILKKAQKKDGYVTQLSGDAIYCRFDDILRNLNIRHYRLHDLRHYVASVMLSLNIPKKYIADYLGHETEYMVERVYGHIMSEKKKTVENQLDIYYTNLMQQKMQQQN